MEWVTWGVISIPVNASHLISSRRPGVAPSGCLVKLLGDYCQVPLSHKCDARIPYVERDSANGRLAVFHGGKSMQRGIMPLKQGGLQVASSFTPAIAAYGVLVCNRLDTRIRRT